MRSGELVFEWNWPAAVAAHRRAIALDPSSAWSHSMLGHVLSQLGRRARGARSWSVVRTGSDVAAPLLDGVAGGVPGARFERARDLARRAIVINPELWVGFVMLGQACEQLGEADVALDALATATRLSNGNRSGRLGGYILATHGQTTAARDVLLMYVHSPASATCRRLQWRSCARGSAKPTGLQLPRSGVCRARCHLGGLTVDTKWDGSGSDPEFTALLARCAFERESQAGVNASRLGLRKKRREHTAVGADSARGRQKRSTPRQSPRGLIRRAGTSRYWIIEQLLFPGAHRHRCRTLSSHVIRRTGGD